jgi:hypothetical protein
MQFEKLDPRQLLSGGLDTSFGGSNGVKLDIPGMDEVIVHSAVDDQGRTVVVGRTTADRFAGKLFMARLNTDGQLDPTFGKRGIITNTPFGTVEGTQVISVAGGYLVAATTPMTNESGVATDSRLIRFTDTGQIDRTFGVGGRYTQQSFAGDIRFFERNNLVWVLDGRESIRATQVRNGFFNSQVGLNPTRFTLEARKPTSDHAQTLQQVADVQMLDDGTLNVLVAERRTLIPMTGNVRSQNGYTVRLYSILPSNQVRKTTIVDTGPWSESNSSSFLRHARLVNGPDRRTVLMDIEPYDVNSGPFTNSLSRPASNLTAVALNSRDRVLSTTSLGNRLGNYYWSGSILQLDGGSLLLGTAKRLAQGGSDNNSFTKLNGDFTLDTDFGTAGHIEPVAKDPSATIGRDVREMSLAPDGTVIASLVSRDALGEPIAARHIRLFTDDKPVASIVRTRVTDTQYRYTINYRSAVPLDRASIGDNDVRMILSPFVFGGSTATPTTTRLKLRPVSIVGSGNSLNVVYVVNRDLMAGALQEIVLNQGAVSTASGETNRGQSLGNLFSSDVVAICPPTILTTDKLSNPRPRLDILMV